MSAITFSHGTGSVIAEISEPFVFAYHGYHWDLRQIFEAGDVITVVPQDNNWSWRISGYQLTLP
jgi:hypothetical protein